MSNKVLRYAYWVNLSSLNTSFIGVVKVDFEVKLGADVSKLAAAITKDWSCSNSYKAQINSWTPMPGENEYRPESYREPEDPRAPKG